MHRDAVKEVEIGCCVYASVVFGKSGHDAMTYAGDQLMRFVHQVRMSLYMIESVRCGG